MVAFLDQDTARYTWVAAAVGSNTAAGYQLSTDDPVMAIGGFNGTDPAPTLAEFQSCVAAGKIHWFIPGGRGPQASGATIAQQITSWVTSTFPSTTVGGVTEYDLTSR